MMWWNGGIGGGGWVLMTLVVVAFWALVVVGLLALLRAERSGEAAGQPPHGSTAAQILDERFARGQIGVAEYRAAKAVLHPVA